MNVIVCVDNKNGLLFNGRRQSRDKAVVKRIQELTNGHKLYVNNFSYKLLDGLAEVNDNFLTVADRDDFCFVENIILQPYLHKINTVYRFKWNRDYPSDFTLDIPIETEFRLVTFEDFMGNSHDNITLEIWEKHE